MAFKGSDVGGREFVSAQEFSVLSKVLSEFSASAEYKALAQYYRDVEQAVQLNEKLKLASLFQEQLVALLKQKTTPVPITVDHINVDLQRYISRLSATVRMLSGTATPVPKIMHFVWVGGSEVGAIQRDYMNIWRQVLEPQGYTFNLWYDSDALLAFEMNRVILDSARVHAMEAGGDRVAKPFELASMIESRARVLKQQMFEYLNEARWSGRADEARIDLMVRAYGKDRVTLEAFRQKCLDTHREMAGSDLQLRDVKQEFSGHFLADVYRREVAMRGNFAAASDVVRLQAEYLEGGRYSDVDYLPPLLDRLGGVDISGYNQTQKIGVLQLFLNHDEALMPGRDRQRYADRTQSIPVEHKDALTIFAKSKPGIHELFIAPQDVSAPRDGFRMGRDMNAHFIAQPESRMTLSIMEIIRFNYDFIYEVEKRAAAAGIVMSDLDGIGVLAHKLADETKAAGKLTPLVESALNGLANAVANYYADGIRVDAGGTITLTGPGAAVNGVFDYIEKNLHSADIYKVRDHLALTTGFNYHTEEETISGWTIRADSDEWLKNEKAKWQDGKLKSRYGADLNQLLNDRTLTFKQGWPVIEGKPVLLTTVLQQLMDDLGEPFIRAMADKLSGDVRFDTAFSIGFDVREQILAQTDTTLPVSLGAESTRNLNELLTHLASGKLTAEHLSPRQRVMLGAIFAADRLDTAGFAGAWQAAVKLATETGAGGLFARYNAIEQVLRQHQGPAFEAGLQRSEVSTTQSSRELKIHAFNEPLTLKQWGQHIGQINRTAQREYHRQILNRGRLVSHALAKAGAISSRQIPQGLLKTTVGDPGRRCYPLALLMAAALPAGEAAERALIGRVANTSLAPDDADSRALLLALDELHATPFTEVGTARGTLDLQSIGRTLEGKTAPAVMLLDTGNHALLVAKVNVGSDTVYRFYDPNFALYGFSAVEQLTQGMQAYLRDNHSEIARLYGLGDEALPRFNVIELNTTAIAEKVLSSNLRVDAFVQNGPVADLQTTTVWEKQVVARTRSLNDNARMGFSLAQVDARYWAGELNQATTRLRTEHNVGREYLPLLETVKVKPEGGYRVTLVDSRNPRTTLEVDTRDARFGRVKKHISRLVQVAAGKPGAVGEADGGSRLSFAFAIQTLITEMRQRDYAAGDPVPALSVALQVQVYVSYAQLGFGVVSDTLQIVNLVRQAVAGEQALRQASLSGRLLSRAATGVGFAFSLANIGFDIYNLSVAQNHEQRSRFSTSLAFNVAALGLDVVALAAGGAAGAAAAFLSVPLLGIGIGVTAIASNLGQIKDKATAVGNHLRDIQNAYREVYTDRNGVLQFLPEAVITHLDLSSREVRFDSQKFFPWKGGALELPQYNDDPQEIHNAIDIRKALGLPEVSRIHDFQDDELHAVVLPCTPICYYGYEYQVGGTGHKYEPMPGEQLEPASASEDVYDQDGNYVVFTRYPQLRDSAADKLEYDGQGQRVFYLHSQPGPLKHILYKLHPAYKPTNISVQLDHRIRQLLVPDLPQEWRNKLSYAITAPTGQYQVRLTPGLLAVRLYGNAKWVVQAPWVHLDQVVFRGPLWENDDGDGQLIVDGMELNAFDGLIELAEGLFRIGWSDNSLDLVSVTLTESGDEARVWGVSKSDGEKIDDLRKVLAFVRKQARERRLATQYVPLYKFKVPFTTTGNDVVTTAWFDVAGNRLLYPRNLPAEVNQGLLLGGVSARHAWFYHPDHATVWQVDAMTGSVVHRYRLMNPATGSKIVGCLQSADGSLHVSQYLPLSTEVTEDETTLEYRIADQVVEMTGIKISSLQHNYRYSRRIDLNSFGLPMAFKDETPGMAAGISSWDFAPFVVVSGYVLEGLRDRSWHSKRTARRFHASEGGAPELLLLMPSAAERAGIIFYNKKAQTVSRGIEPKIGEFKNVVIEREVVEVTQTAGHYIATKSNGRLYEIDLGDVPPAGPLEAGYEIDVNINRSDYQWMTQPDKPSVLKFVGVGQQWLQHNPDWLTALPALAKEYKATPFPIIGLANVSGNGFLAAWCVDEKIAVADFAQGKELRLLGRTPDKQAVWLLEVSAGQLYRQPLVAIESLRAAFASGARLRFPALLPKSEKVWSQWSFTQVQPQGQGLLGQTREGVNVELPDRQPGRIVSVENRWWNAPDQSREQLQARLKALLEGHPHAPVLPVENTGDRFQYYAAELDRFFDLTGRADGQWPVVLGNRGESVLVLFGPDDGRVFNRVFIPGFAELVWTTVRHAQREGEVLSIETGEKSFDLPTVLPDGVDQLVLTFGAELHDYRLTDDIWQRLDCLVINSRRAPGSESLHLKTLTLDLKLSANLLMSLVDGHLLFTDPDSVRSLIVRDAQPRNDEPDLPLQIEVQYQGRNCAFTVKQWLAGLAQAAQDKTTINVADVLETLV
ncbi:insecticidal toxin [Pseudomonas sp. IT-347P]|uniref:TcdA/TcdB pore-forming domain-containing protein n=1 Tax=Pseudomonas sp. IT-347P TaxID=3026458 RepID=UPI0039E1F387